MSCRAVTAPCSADEEYDVVIVGLGPVGAVAANLLGQAGHTVLVVDQTDGAGLRPRAGGLDDENLRLLQNLGLVEQFLETSEPMAVAQVVSTYLPANDDGPSPYDPSLPDPVFLLNGFQAPEGVGRPGSWPPMPDIFWPGRNGYPLGARGFYQPKFEDILRKGLERFDNVTTRLSTRCVNLSQSGSFARVQLQAVKGSWKPTPGNEVTFVSEASDSSYVVNCKFVVGCDGARSAVRKGMDSNAMQSLDYDERWWACDVKLLKPDKELFGTKLPFCSQLVADPRRSYTVVPLWQVTDSPVAGRHVRFDIQVRSTDKEQDLQSAEKIKHLISPWLSSGDCELVRFAIYRFWSLLAERWRYGRIFLAGDACHTMPPFLGQGLNQGLKDVTNLCWKLSIALQGLADWQSVLDTYEEERKPLVKAVVEGSLNVGRMIDAMRKVAAHGQEALKKEVENSRGQGLEGGLPLAASKLKQKTEGFRAYPRIISSKGEDRFAGQPFPQLRLKQRTKPKEEPVLLDDVLRRRSSRPTFVLLTVSMDGASAKLSASNLAFLHRLGGIIFPLALELPALDCDYSIATEEHFKEVCGRAAPFAALLRPDRFVLGCTRLECAEDLLEELRLYLFNHTSVTSKL